jgi:hypothetical protein
MASDAENNKSSHAKPHVISFNLAKKRQAKATTPKTSLKRPAEAKINLHIYD